MNLPAPRLGPSTSPVSNNGSLFCGSVICAKKSVTPYAGTGSSEQLLLSLVYPKQMRHLMQARVCRIRSQISHLDFGHAEDAED